MLARLQNNWLIILLLVLLAALQYQYHFGYANNTELQKKLAANQELQKENLQLQNKHMLIFAEIEDLKKGKEILEQHAREELGLIKDNEIFIQYNPR